MAGETILFPDWRPDITPLGTNVSPNILNVVPREDGFGPFPDLAILTASLPGGKCRGYFYARNLDGSISIFAGTPTDLYLLNNTTFQWTLVSKGGVSYSPLSASDNWQFAQFGLLVFATQANAPLQVYNLGVSTAFADNAGSPPQARYIKIISRFVVLSGLLNNPNRVQWSDLNNTTQWTAGVGLSDFQDLPEGGIVRGCSGGEQYGFIFQETKIRTITFAPGTPEIFTILALPSEDGLYASYSIISANNGTFFISPQGFKFAPFSGVPTPIGKERVDRTFFGDVDTANLQLVIGASDPTSTRVFWAYKSKQGAPDAFDTIILYDWALNKFTKISKSGQYIAALASPGLTLEALDNIAPGNIAVTGAANNGSGLIRLALTTTAGLATGQVVAVGQANPIVGTTEANGNWTITVIDGTHIDLQGSAFVNAYVSGGSIGGSLDAMTFSLDSISTAALTQLSGCDAAGAIGFFNSNNNLQATIETAEQDMGRRYLIQGVRPMTDGASALCALVCRDNAQQQAAVTTTATAIGVDGVCPQRKDTRYARVQLVQPYGAQWTYARGVQPIAKPTGTR